MLQASTDSEPSINKTTYHSCDEDGQGRREKSEQPHEHEQTNHISAQHIIYSLSYLQSISRIFSHNVHFTTNRRWLHEGKLQAAELLRRISR